MKQLYYLLFVIQCMYGPIYAMESDPDDYFIQESLRAHKKHKKAYQTGHESESGPETPSLPEYQTDSESGSQQTTPRTSQSQPVENCLPYKQAFFNGKTIKTNLLKFIKAEKKRIAIAIYIFTDYEIAQALLEARNRGVLIEIVADYSQSFIEHAQLPRLANAGINVYIWDPLKGLMHNKFIIFESTLNDQTLVWTGSYNFSKAASGTNQENALILEDTDITSRYKFQFGKLKSNSKRLHPIPTKKV